jgi:hypothetical protein
MEVVGIESSVRTVFLDPVELPGDAPMMSIRRPVALSAHIS